ncbi:uncharacterized protein [Paramisgurnus dabryanus]|uniref:uncharacterized protein n=1 Tax=Paramisgurnus dabryanus TaxID=90735 RepID=UPI003CCFC0D5
MMRIGAEMKMLAVVGVLIFMVGVSDSVILTKCGLKQELEASGLTLPQDVLNQTKADMLAKIVCHVNLTSGFNTSAIKQIANPNNCTNSQSRNQGSRKGRSARIGKASSEEGSASVEKHGDGCTKLWMLYGLFQLSDTVACSSTRAPSLNLCGLSCSKLIDNDIKDDLACFQVMINKITAVVPDQKVAAVINEMIALIYQKECVDVVASSYFADC